MTRDQIIEARQALVSQLPVTGEMLRGSLLERTVRHTSGGGHPLWVLTSAMPAAVLASSACAANRLMKCAGGSAITTSSRKRSRTSASSTTRCCGRIAPRRDAQGRTHDPDAAGAAHLW